MFSSRKIKWICALAAVSGMVNADVMIDDQVIPNADLSGVISVNPASGRIIINTIPGYAIVRGGLGDDVAISNFYASPDSITAGDSTTIYWATQNADSCSASNGFGTWSGDVPVSGSRTVSTATPNTYTFTLTCQGTGGPVSDTTSVTVNAAGSVSITSLSASPPSIIEGGTTTIYWATQNADSCSASDGFGTWSGDVPVNGSRAVSTATPNTYTFTLTCQGSGGPVSDTTSVTVTEAVPGCDTPPMSGNEFEWVRYWGEAFPNPKSLLREAQIPMEGWLAVKFNTGNYDDTGSFSSIESTKTSGTRLGAISQCPGDFEVPVECRYSWGIGGGILWSTEGYRNACDLLPNTDYYFNVTFTNGLDPDSTTCDAVPCVTKLRYYKF